MEAEMGKIREQFAGDMVAGLAQWVGRKLKNHDPMSAMDGGAYVRGLKVSRQVQDAKVKPGQVYCGIVNGKRDTVRYGLQDGRVFEVTIREVDESEEPVLLTAVGS
jgi:hypothetical protein